MSKTILVTGGAGFIGSSLTEFLITKGYNTICFDNFDPFYSRATKESNLQQFLQLKNFTLIEEDLRNKEAVQDAFRNYPIDLVVHLAAKTGVRPSIENKTEYFEVNINGTLNLLEAMEQHKVTKLLFASSSSVYGNNKKIPFSETDHVDFPISPYAASKKSGELLTHTFHHLYHIDTINLRFFTVYGPKQRPDLAIHKFFKSIYSNQPINIYGDGDTSRDYTYIDDIISGIYSAIQYLEKHQGVYEIINIGNHKPTKLNELIKLIEQVSGKRFIKEYLPMQLGDVEQTYADINKAQQLLNYQPKTDILDGLQKFNIWFLANKDKV